MMLKSNFIRKSELNNEIRRVIAVIEPSGR